jgi:hypothetical protein
VHTDGSDSETDQDGKSTLPGFPLRMPSNSPLFSAMQQGMQQGMQQAY